MADNFKPIQKPVLTLPKNKPIGIAYAKVIPCCPSFHELGMLAQLLEATEASARTKREWRELIEARRVALGQDWDALECEFYRQLLMQAPAVADFEPPLQDGVCFILGTYRDRYHSAYVRVREKSPRAPN